MYKKKIKMEEEKNKKYMYLKKFFKTIFEPLDFENERLSDS